MFDNMLFVYKRIFNLQHSAASKNKESESFTRYRNVIK